MISTREQSYLLTTENFSRCLQIVTRSHAVELIEGYHSAVRGPGGRPRSRRRFTILAVLVVALAVMASRDRGDLPDDWHADRRAARCSGYGP